MKIMIITTGEPKLSFAKEGIKEYLKRIQGFASVELIHVKENKKTEDKILKILDKKYVILLDENGSEYSSLSLSTFLTSKKQMGANLCFVIGGPDGHSDEIKQQADSTISLSRLTFPHDIAMMLCLETLYRSLSIEARHPYHRLQSLFFLIYNIKYEV